MAEFMKGDKWLFGDRNDEGAKINKRCPGLLKNPDSV